MHQRLHQQLDFIFEVDKLKTILRQTWLLDRSRRENSAEHSWHLGLMALVLEEQALPADVDLHRVVKMLLVHDIVEIDAGDTFCYDEEAGRDKVLREEQAADRIFALLPDDQGAELRALWDEFEARESASARFAVALDRLQPLLHNLRTEGAAWREHGVTRPQVVARNRHIADGSPALWAMAERLIDEAVEKGHLDAGTEC